MKKIVLMLLVLAGIGLAGLPAVETASLTGSWNFTMQSPRGERSSVVQLRQEGEKLFVTMKNMRGEEVASEGTVKNGEVEWVSVRQTPRGEMRISYKGRLDGQTLRGSAAFAGGEGPGMTWSAVRAAAN